MESRGPPLKPKRSGHALWVGNLHPATSIVELKDHFSQGAIDDIESVFLIARSTCAFVNYQSEQACRSAQSRFHSSRLHGNVLVCRLRRDLAFANHDALTPSTSSDSESSVNSKEEDTDVTSPVIVGAPSSRPSNRTAVPEATALARVKIPEKFFVLKSLTTQDLVDSVQRKTWTTQPHNEAALNKAYQDTTNVYLIFSVNKSREYFGFARMASPISCIREDKAQPAMDASVEYVPPRSPTSIPTPATSFAPKGRIVDDSARGTVFWEATVAENGQSQKSGKEECDDTPRQGSAGREFKVEWLSLIRVPFFRTRGLCNSWNANREVSTATTSRMSMKPYHA